MTSKVKTMRHRIKKRALCWALLSYVYLFLSAGLWDDELGLFRSHYVADELNAELRA